MDALILVEVLDDHGTVHARHRLSGEGASCRIGRSLACEVNIDDPYAAAEHTQVTVLPDGRALVRDLGTRNGTRHDGKLVDPGTGSVISHGELLVGRTRVRIRTPDAQLPPERLFRRDLLRRHRTLLAGTGILLCLAFVAFTQWLRMPSSPAQRVLIGELLALAAIAIWVAAWALVSRLTVGSWQVRIHAAIAATCMALWVWGWWLYTLAVFALQWRWLGAVAALLAGAVALAAAYLHLRQATHIPRLASLSLAMLAPLIGGGVWWLVDQQLDPRTVNRVVLGPAVQPASLRLAPSLDAGDYLSDVAALKREASRLRQQSLLETPLVDADD